VWRPTRGRRAALGPLNTRRPSRSSRGAGGRLGPSTAWRLWRNINLNNVSLPEGHANMRVATCPGAIPPAREARRAARRRSPTSVRDRSHVAAYSVL